MSAETAGQELILQIVETHIAVVILNRPRALNAINVELTEQLAGIVKRVEQEESIRVAILTSSSERAFCAGSDLKEIAQGLGPLTITPDGGFAGFVDAVREKPWIAAVSGYALGGGCELALACDMVIASQEASFGLPEVTRGLYAGAGGAFRLPRAIPRNIALELIATGRSITSARAATLGLVNLVTTQAALLPSALDLARTIATNAPLAVRESLEVARRAADLSLDELRATSDRASRRVFASDDAREGAAAFVEKRAANWTGR